jgi:hypothetical protein
MNTTEKVTCWVIGAFFLASVFLLATNSLGDYDTGFHLATGRYIVEHKEVPLYDVFSYTASGERLIAHYWLSDVVFFLLFEIFGPWGLVLAVAALGAVTYALVLATVSVRKHFVPLAATFLVPFIYFTMRLWEVRPQVFSYLFVALLVYMLERWRLSGKNVFLWVLVPLFLLWANMHAGVTLGCAIVWLYGVWAVWRWYWERKKFPVLPLVVAALSSLAVLVNPNGVAILTYSSIIAKATKEAGIQEWMSLVTFAGTQLKYRVFLWSSVVITAAGLWLVSRRARPLQRLDIISAGLVSAAFVLPLISVRHIAFFPLLAVPIAAGELASYAQSRPRWPRMLQILWIPMVALVMLSTLAGLLHVRKMPVWNRVTLPIGAVDFIESERVQGPLFNLLESGGYLMWRLWPGEKVFIDGRSELYEGTINDDYFRMLSRAAGWETLVDSVYGFNTVILYYRAAAVGSGKNLVLDFARALATQKQFKLVYWDDAAIVLVRDAAPNTDVVKRFAYEVIGPYIEPESIPPALYERAGREFDRALKASHGSDVIENFAFRFVLKQRQEAGTGF